MIYALIGNKVKFMKKNFPKQRKKMKVFEL